MRCEVCRGEVWGVRCVRCVRCGVRCGGEVCGV